MIISFYLIQYQIIYGGDYMQNKVKEFNSKLTCCKKPMPVCARLLDISSELGELQKEYLKASSYGTKEFQNNSDFEMEFGDVLYSLMCLANECGLNAYTALEKALEKYSKRVKNNNSLGSGR